MLKAQNPNSTFLTEGPTHNGVYDTDNTQTLYLYVDVKTDGETTFPYVIKELEPLRAAGFLTTWNGTGITPGAVTVVGTGNTPLNQIQGVEPRDYFYDAPIPYLGTTFSNITANVSDGELGFRGRVWRGAESDVQCDTDVDVGGAGGDGAWEGDSGAVLGFAWLADWDAECSLANSVGCWGRFDQCG